MNGRSRRRPPIITRIPWWGFVLLAGGSYVLLKYFAPDLATAVGYPAISGFLALLAPIITIGFLLLAAACLYEGDMRDQSPPPESSIEGKNDEDEPGPDA